MEKKTYLAGYAKSGRSSCHACKQPIGQHSLRLGKNKPSRFFDGFETSYYHAKCLVKRDGKSIQSDNIDGFESLKYSDQVKIRDLLGEKQGIHTPHSNACIVLTLSL